MSKIEPLTPILSSYTGITKLNGHLDKIEVALNNTLSRDGSSPNEMEADINMNDNQLINTGSPALPHHVATKAYVDELVTGVTGEYLQPAGSYIRDVATYAELTALTSSTGLIDNGVYYTYTRTTEEDGGAGFWRYDSASTVTANGGTVLAINGGGAGRFVRLYGGAVFPEWFGSCGAAVNSYSALNAALNSGAKNVVARGQYGLSTGIIIPADVVLDATGASFFPLANINVIRLHGGAQLIGDPLIDCSSQVGWNSAAVLFSGASESSSSTYFRLNKQTVARVRCKCTTTGSSHGTAISFQTVDDGVNNQWIMGVDVEATVEGFDKALHMVKDGADLIRTFITSNYIKIDGESALQTIVMESDHPSGWSLDGNQFVIRMQSRAQADQLAIPVVLCGAQNLWEILQWDWLGGPLGTTKVCTLQSGAQLNTLTTWMDPALITNSSTSRTNIFTNLWTEQGLVFGEMRSIATDTVIRMHGSLLRADSQKGFEFENAAGSNEWISFTTDSGDNTIVKGNSAAGDGIYLNAANSTGFVAVQIDSVLGWLIDSNKHMYYPGFAGNSNAITFRNFNTGGAFSQDFTDGAGVVPLKVSVPATATSSGKVGMWAADSSWLYACTASNTWRRVAIATW